jgi:hypothetical protein
MEAELDDHGVSDRRRDGTMWRPSAPSGSFSTKRTADNGSEA